jgi:hypothetical protein
VGLASRLAFLSYAAIAQYLQKFQQAVTTVIIESAHSAPPLIVLVGSASPQTDRCMARGTESEEVADHVGGINAAVRMWRSG